MSGERDTPRPTTPAPHAALDPALGGLTRRRMRRDQRQAKPSPASTLQSLEPRLLLAGDVVYALNAGGIAFTDANGVAWVNDTTFTNEAAADSQPYTSTDTINLTDASVPANTDEQIFQSERWDNDAGAEMLYSLAVDNGEYEIGLYFADIYSGTQGVGQRVFDVQLEGNTVLDDYDIFADVGGYTGVVKTFNVEVLDGTLNIEFIHEVENPAVKAILVRTVGDPTPDPIAPVLDLNGAEAGTEASATFTGGLPVNATAADALLTDADSATLTSLTVTLGNTPDGGAEFLLASTVGTGLTSTYDFGSRTLSIAGSGSVADYQTALRTVAYFNTATNPDTTPRTLTFVANDGAVSSTPATATIDFDLPAPDPVAPELDLNGSDSGVNTTATFSVGQGPVSIVPAEATLTDADSSTLSSLTVTLDSIPDGADESLAADTTGTALSATYTAGTGVLSITGTASVADYQAVLRTVTYDNAAAEPNPLTRTAVFVANDGVMTSSSASSIVLIQPPDGEPGQLVYAINAGGSALTDPNGIDWSTDQGFTNDLAAISYGYITGSSIDLSDPSVPTNTTDQIFKSERWDFIGGDEMSFDLNVDNGSYQVDLYFADIYSGTQGVGLRVFDVQLEGVTVLDDYDIFADVGGYAGVVKSFDIAVVDGVIDIDFLRGVENPAIKGIVVRTAEPIVPDPIAPVLDLDAVAGGTGYTAEFLAGDGPVNIAAADATLSDADSAVIESITVVLASTPDGASERLDADVTGTGISKAFAGGTLSLTGVATVAEYQAVLRTVTYDNLASEPDLTPRTVNFVANDGQLDSNTASATVNLTPNNQPQPGTLVSNVISTLDFNNAQTGVVERITVTLTHPGDAIDDPVVVTGTNITGINAADFGDLFASTYGSSVTMNPGESIDLTFYVLPGSTGAKFASVEILHSGTNTLSFGLEANAVDPVAVGFGTTTVNGLDATSPTTLQWGPDNRLYVGTLDGLIHAYTITRNGANDYAVTDSETITLVQEIPNHEDDGTLNPSVDTRLITGIKVVGTASDPVIYVTSSDPRLTNGTNSSIDTNSGIVSKLTQNPDDSWSKVDLVRGLPRSTVDHAPHGLQLIEDSNTLLVAVGGLTNAGAPAEFFGNLPEYALSAAILSLDLDAIEALPTQTDANGQQFKHNLPTLDDEDRATNNDANDPFGGNAGKNQAILEENGLVDIFASGLRNPYDFVFTQFGQVYVADNGPNSSIGDVPILDPNGLPTNQPNPGGTTAMDALHLVTEGSYSGHPNPTRANTNNTFNPTNPQSPVYNGYTEAFDYQENGSDGALALFDTSTNGIVEYTASGFDGALNGDLLTVSIDGKLTRLKLSPDGTTVISSEVLFNSVGNYPLDVTAVGDGHPFAGTIWVADLFGGTQETIRVYEPDAGSGQGTPDDLDGDGYSNDDEIDNGTNPNSAGDTPPDNDTDFVSDLNDPDDDNDTIDDVNDPFQVDDTNGNNTDAPYLLSFDNDDLNRGGLLDLGFTGVMANGSTSYLDQFDFANLTAGSAAGVLTIDAVDAGTALGNANTQNNAFQFGINLNADSSPVTIQTNINSVFDNATPVAGQRAGLYFGTGDQDNYIAVFIEGDGTINTVTEVNGVATLGTPVNVGNNFTNLNLYLTVDPDTLTVQAAYSYGTGAITDIPGTLAFPASWLTATTAPAVGVIATTGGAEAYSVTYDFIRVDPATIDDGQAPFNNTPHLANQRVEAEHFDLGGNGIAYLDLTAFNEGPANTRPGEFVDIEPTTDTDGGVNVGWIEAGEWLEYTFDLENAGTYSADFRVAMESGTGSTFHLEINGQNISGPIDLPVTGGWQNWQTVTANDLQLEAGPMVLRVVFDTPSLGRFVGNLNWLQLNYEAPSEGNPPTVNAGVDAAFAGPSGTAALDGTVTDDSTNNVPLRTYWNLVTGPAAVTFDDPYAVDTNANFTAPGVYILRLSADNGIGGVISDDIRVTVNPQNSGIVYELDVLNEADSSTLGTLATNPLDPGDIVWNTILIDESQIKNFMGNPDGSTDSPATGSATFSYDASTNELSYEITYSGLTADLTNIHIHGPANAGTSNMAHIFDVFSGEQDVIDSGVDRRNATVTGVVNLTSHTHGGNNPTPTLAEALEALTTGQAYVNVHTTAFPMGEIRGNVPVAVPAEDPFFDLGVINATTLRFSPTTTSGVDTVRYFLNGVELTDGNGPGREVTWQATTGDHTLVAIPSDGQNDGPAMTFKFSVRADPGETRLAEWQQLANSPYAQFEGQGIDAGGKLYLFGGFINGGLQVTDRFAVYDPATDTWTDLADVPLQLTHANHVVDGDNIYVLGGYVGTHPGGSTDAVWVYNIPTDTWSAGPSLPEDRAGAGAAILGRTLYYFGGATRTQGSVASTVDHGDVWTLDLGATDSTGDDAASWTTGTVADMPEPRNHMAGVSLNGFLYAIGGQIGEDEFNGNSESVHRYDPNTDTWTSVADLPIKIGHITASTFTANGRIFVVTGVTQNSVSTDTFFMYDPTTDTWTSLPPAPVASQSPIVAHIDGKIYLTGGDDSPGGISNKTYVLDLNESWFNLPSMPAAMGEVAAGIIGDTLYIVGESNNSTLAYNIATGTWSGLNDLAQRPFIGHHHAAEVIDGKLYLFGGLGGGSNGKVQIYDPVADSWTTGTDIPFATGSASSALIDGKVYLASGIIGSSTTQQAAVYDPVLDSWTSIANIPDDANHAAAATDGSKFYVFGGRTGGNVVGDGFNTVQVYDPNTNTWESSSNPGSFLTPMPEARGGTGKAVFLNGEFYVFGGETLTSAAADANGVYDRVDIYNPVTNTWRSGTPIPTARHGIFPLEHAGVIYLAGGGTQAGFSASNLLEAYYVDVL
ncbi:Kelch repeat-containing protein [Algisphaera agarilytica]|uniref:N-acetylneuraminic acid mutarotase n=1 Tax=Algisphaera agarilytica TaxID=1385975 RepID=A0A7X0LJV2_9BACT|nr:malectin domain-containing carbohydrate-binding protein [Algisphaera agarilytica]MBB6429242.1 N-acetylneuraminic acid mutarotase [Algisphaera agarilytica]